MAFYQIIKANDSEILEYRVNQQLAIGFKLHGFPFIEPVEGDDATFYQALIFDGHHRTEESLREAYEEKCARLGISLGEQRYGN